MKPRCRGKERGSIVNYDKESFLAGIAVGRLLGPRDEGITR